MTTLTNNPTLGMYVAAAVAIAVVLGLLIYLWIVDRRVEEIRRALAGQITTPAASEDPLRPKRLTKEPADGTLGR